MSSEDPPRPAPEVEDHSGFPTGAPVARPARVQAPEDKDGKDNEALYTVDFEGNENHAGFSRKRKHTRDLEDESHLEARERVQKMHEELALQRVKRQKQEEGRRKALVGASGWGPVVRDPRVLTKRSLQVLRDLQSASFPTSITAHQSWGVAHVLQHAVSDFPDLKFIDFARDLLAPRYRSDSEYSEENEENEELQREERPFQPTRKPYN